MFPEKRLQRPDAQHHDNRAEADQLPLRPVHPGNQVRHDDADSVAGHARREKRIAPAGHVLDNIADVIVRRRAQLRSQVKRAEKYHDQHAGDQHEQPLRQLVRAGHQIQPENISEQAPPQVREIAGQHHVDKGAEPDRLRHFQEAEHDQAKVDAGDHGRQRHVPVLADTVGHAGKRVGAEAGEPQHRQPEGEKKLRSQNQQVPQHVASGKIFAKINVWTFSVGHRRMTPQSV